MIWNFQKKILNIFPYVWFHLRFIFLSKISFKKIWNFSEYSLIYGSLLLFFIDNKHWYSWLLYILKWCYVVLSFYVKFILITSTYLFAYYAFKWRNPQVLIRLLCYDWNNLSVICQLNIPIWKLPLLLGKWTDVFILFLFLKLCLY